MSHADEPLALLGGLSRSGFLQRYWQKTPRLIRGALPDYRAPLSPEELAGLACEPEVESRLVLERGPEGAPWHLRRGPFGEDDFTRLPRSHWTLLVQEVNKYIPALADLLDRFDFIPGWRVDDVMVSYAAEGGSVGAHVDQYDVFLLQGLGQRRWSIDTAPVTPANRVAGTELDVLREFTPEQEWVLEPGDMLYLPPGVAHHGVALGDCMTLSIGFRAPAEADLVRLFYDHAAEQLNDAQRYADPALYPPAHPGEIDADALARVRDIVRRPRLSEAEIDRWFGSYVTEPPLGQGLAPREEPIPAAEPAAGVRAGRPLRRSDYGRYAYIERGPEGVLLFVDGRERPCAPTLAPLVALLCDRRRYAPAELAPWLERPEAAALLRELYCRNALYFEDELED